MTAYDTWKQTDQLSEQMAEYEAKHAAHAINHVDALADALEALLVESQCHAGSLGFYQAQDDAKAALKAYRGEK
jgi:hypothetical protein